MRPVHHHGYPDSIEFTVTCTMRARWVPHFLGMLKRMQYLGSVGSSREVKIYADGDGDFRPKFEWSADLPEAATAAHTNTNGDEYFDAG